MAARYVVEPIGRNAVLSQAVVAGTWIIVTKHNTMVQIAELKGCYLTHLPIVAEMLTTAIGRLLFLIQVDLLTRKAG